MYTTYDGMKLSDNIGQNMQTMIHMIDFSSLHDPSTSISLYIIEVSMNITFHVPWLLHTFAFI